MAASTYTFIAPTDAALPPPPGVIPTFDDPYTLRPYQNVVFSLGMFFSGMFLLARLYTKAFIVRAFKWEDYTCILGFAFFCGWTALKFKVTNAGGGVHQWNLTTQDLSDQYRWTNYSDMLYSPTALFTKLSIILLVLRIFCPQRRDRFYWALQSLNILNTIFYIAYIIIPIVQCHPRRKIWDKNTSGGSCLDIYVLYTISGTFNALSDLAIFFVPLWRIWNLQISRSRKLGISAIFCSGGLAVASSLFRLIFSTFLFSSQDYSYLKEQSTIWGHAEISFGIICSCLFVLPRLYRHLASIPPYGSDEYDDYQRRKFSGDRGWSEHTERSRGIGGGWKGSGSGSGGKKKGGVVMGGIDSEIEKPPAVPPKSWLYSVTKSRSRSRSKTESEGGERGSERFWAAHLRKGEDV